MQTTRRMVAILGLVASLLSLGCAPRFPAGSPAVDLPIRDPLLGPDPSVRVTWPGGEGPWSSWMYPDSGVPVEGALLPPASAARLGPHYADWCVTPVPFGLIPWQVGRAGLLSSLTLGDLVVRDVPVIVARVSNARFPSGLLGQAILGHAPWEIDWDRGTLTLGAMPWPEGPDTIVVPLQRRWGLDFVTVQVDGHPIEMFLDTAADLSMIPVDTSRNAGLSVQAVDRWHYPTGKVIPGDVALGPLPLNHLDFLSTPHIPLGYGLLGLDVLSRYHIQVVPGERLALRPRGDPWETAPQRIARWPWTRVCQTLGCVRAHVEPAGDEARVVFSFEVDVPHPVTVILGCREADPVGSHLLSWDERVSSGRTGGPWYHVVVIVPSAAKDRIGEAVVVGSSGWLSRTGCRDLSVLDVVPSLVDKASGGAGSFMF